MRSKTFSSVRSWWTTLRHAGQEPLKMVSDLMFVMGQAFNRMPLCFEQTTTFLEAMKSCIPCLTGSKNVTSWDLRCRKAARE